MHLKQQLNYESLKNLIDIDLTVFIISNSLKSEEITTIYY